MKVGYPELKWPEPGGATQRCPNLPLDCYITIVEGENKWK